MVLSFWKGKQMEKGISSDLERESIKLYIHDGKSYKCCWIKNA